MVFFFLLPRCAVVSFFILAIITVIFMRACFLSFVLRAHASFHPVSKFPRNSYKINQGQFTRIFLVLPANWRTGGGVPFSAYLQERTSLFKLQENTKYEISKPVASTHLHLKFSSSSSGQALWSRLLEVGCVKLTGKCR